MSSSNSSSRETILSRVRGALHPLKERAAYPTFPDNAATSKGANSSGDPWTTFKVRTQLVNGLAFDTVAELVAWLRANNHLRGYCDPVLWPVLKPTFGDGFTVETTFDRTRVDDYQFGLTRAAGAIAETGSLVLKDASTSSRLAALAPWVHIALVQKSDVYLDVAAAVAQLGRDSNVIWCTGPSKTADVEGILIQGVHGPGVQIAVLAA